MVEQERRGYAARQQQGTDLDRFAGGSMSDHGVTLLTFSA